MSLARFVLALENVLSKAAVASLRHVLPLLFTLSTNQGGGALSNRVRSMPIDIQYADYCLLAYVEDRGTRW